MGKVGESLGAEYGLWRLAVASHGKGFNPALSHAGFLF